MRFPQDLRQQVLWNQREEAVRVTSHSRVEAILHRHLFLVMVCHTWQDNRHHLQCHLLHPHRLPLRRRKMRQMAAHRHNLLLRRVTGT